MTTPLKPKICPFCESNLFLNSNAECYCCGHTINDIEFKNKYGDALDIMKWRYQRRLFFGWETQADLDWKKQKKFMKQERRMIRLKHRLDKWYRIHKKKRIILKNLQSSKWKCDFCERETESPPFSLEFSFEEYPWDRKVFGCLLICYDCHRYTTRLIREKNIIKLLRITKESYEKKE